MFVGCALTLLTITLKVFEPTIRNGLGTIIQILFPQLMYLIRVKSVAQDVEDFIISMVKGTLDYRETNNVVRKDFFQLMIQLRNTGSVQLDDQWETKIVNDSQKKLSINEMAAQVELTHRFPLLLQFKVIKIVVCRHSYSG